MSLPHDPQTDALFSAILSLSTPDECYAFFEDICTVKELRDLGQRLTVARLMRSGSSYIAAQQQTGASSATIGRVKRCLDYGAGGYALVLDRMKEESAGD